MNALLRLLKTASFGFAVLTLFADCLAAQEKKTDLPTGEAIIQKHIDATGGQAAYDKVQNRVFESTIEIVNQGVKLNAKTFAAKPNKHYSVIKADAVGKILKGCTGEIAWSTSDMRGPVVEEGAALENQLRDSVLDRIVYWKRAYSSVECVAIEKVNDRDCYKLVFTPPAYKSKDAKELEPSKLSVFVDQKTFFVNKIESNLVTAVGTIDVTGYLSDYRTVDGLKIAHRTELHLVGQKRLIQIESMKHNVELAADQFDPPEEIKKLIAKSKRAEIETPETTNKK